MATNSGVMDIARFTYLNEDLVSSALDCIWYNVFNRVLFVEFPNGTVAGYGDVTPDEVRELESANSVGAYFGKNIKGKKRGVNSDVDLKPFNANTYSNTRPEFVPGGPDAVEQDDWKNTDRQEAMLSEYSEITDNQNEGTYKISFVVEATTEFKAPSGNILKALELFVGSFNEGNKDASVRVRSIAEIV